MQTLTKNSSVKATAAHLSIIAHITKDELRRYLDRTEIANGFANRFIWLCVRRSKLLPEGGSPDPSNVQPLIRRLDEAVHFGRQLDRVERDPAARELWVEVYPDLSEGQPGLLGAATSRAEAQVMRLALLYAVLDCSRVIGEGHLRAALALWKYAHASETPLGILCQTRSWLRSDARPRV